MSKVARRSRVHLFAHPFASVGAVRLLVALSAGLGTFGAAGSAADAATDSTDPTVKLSCPDRADGSDDKVKCSATADDPGKESSGIASLRYRARLKDGAWLPWQDTPNGDTFTYPAVVTMDVQALAVDTAGRSATELTTIKIPQKPVNVPPPTKVPGAAAPPAMTCEGLPATILGTTGDDQGKAAIIATAGVDVIITMGGADEVIGTDANDLVCEQPDSASVAASLAAIGEPDDGLSALDELAASAAPSTSVATATLAGTNIATTKPFGYTNDHTYPDLEAHGGATFSRIAVKGCPGINWIPYDDAFYAHGVRGMKILVTVIMGGSAECGAIRPPTDLNAWLALVRDSANHAFFYGGATNNVWVEVWNEPNLGELWGAPADPVGYGVALYYAWWGVQYAEANFGGINFPVMTAGMGRPGDPCPGNLNPAPLAANYRCDRKFLEDLKAVLASWSALSMVEMTGAHIYPYLSSANLHSRDEYRVEVGRQFDRIREHFQNVQTFITEAGITSDDPLNEYRQCDRLLDIYNGWLPSSATKGMAVFRLINNTTDPGAGPAFWRMGTRKDASTPKVAYAKLREAHNGSGATDCPSS